MAKVTSKLQVTIPKVLAEHLGIRPGDDIEWTASGDSLRVTPRARSKPADRALRLELYDLATKRARRRKPRFGEAPPEVRGWSRAELYDRGSG
jgi:AbrB family looped-hinge helix DNA binding protein